jgi:ferredoxin-type protein NapF
MFSAPFSLVSDVSDRSAWWCASGMITVLVLSLIWPGIWCVRLCPLGAVQDVLYAPKKILRSWKRRSGEATQQERSWQVTRRVALGTALGALGVGAANFVKGQTRRRLRPPGAREESQFAGLCVRCGNCARACPAKIIRPDLDIQNITGLLTPFVQFDDDYCREDCTRCTEVCPSGALATVTADQKMTTIIGRPHVDMDLCLLGDDRECSLCRSRCPFEAITYVFSEIEYTLTPHIDTMRCPGCGACEVACPTTPDKAIVVVPLSSEHSAGIG